MSEILIINGPNINMLGKRENDIYGDVTYESLIAKINDFSSEKNLKTQFFQSNAEHEIVSTIQCSIDQNISILNLKISFHKIFQRLRKNLTINFDLLNI